MNSSKAKGNNPEMWQKLLHTLDDKLQLGLLDHIRRASSYHFEESTLYIEPGSLDDEKYLLRDPVIQQLQILAHDAIGIERVRIKRIKDN